MLPTNASTAWPPEGRTDVLREIEIYSAWYSGDLIKLSDVAYRTFWTPEKEDQILANKVRQEIRRLVHMPIAADLASLSANMLFSEHPIVTIAEANKGENPDGAAVFCQERLQYIIEANQFPAVLLQAAELASAMGGAYMKVNWDKELSDCPIIAPALNSNAIPTFRYGRLVSVIFCRTLSNDGVKVVRLLEDHTPGYIETAVYVGSSNTIGTRMPLDLFPETTGMPDKVKTGATGLACVYIPNMLPNRKDPGSCEGQSDLSGIESLMETLNEVYTSLLREFRIGKGRIVVPKDFLVRDNELGTRYFDLDQEVFVPVSTNVTQDKLNDQITAQQFSIRSTEHLDACKELITRIVASAGYAPQSVGIDAQGTAESGTALRVRERKSFVTTAKKGEYWRPAIEALLFAALEVDREQFTRGLSVFKPNVVIQDSVVYDLAEMATTLDTLNRAQAVSTHILVSMLHPEWDADEVEAEVERIKEANAPPADLGFGEPDNTGTE